MAEQDVKHSYDEVADRLKSGMRSYVPDFVFKLPMEEREEHYIEAREKYYEDYDFYYDERLREVFSSIVDKVEVSPFMIEQILYIFQTKLKQWKDYETILENFDCELKPDPLADRDIYRHVYWIDAYDGGIRKPLRKRMFKISVDFDYRINIKEYKDSDFL